VLALALTVQFHDWHRGSAVRRLADDSPTNGFANSPNNRRKCRIGEVLRSTAVRSAALGKRMGSRGAPPSPATLPLNVSIPSYTYQCHRHDSARVLDSLGPLSALTH
jgi:hypothetical protein